MGPFRVGKGRAGRAAAASACPSVYAADCPIIAPGYATPQPAPAENRPMTEPTVPTRVWDLPTRVFHWALAACVIAAVASAKMDQIAWHFRFGYAVCGLLAFRLVWGFVGGRWSRFASFLWSPGALKRYLRGTPRDGELLEVGHSPAGALSVFAMLAVLIVQVATGLVGDDEIASVGPLNHLVSTDTGLAATGWHTRWGQWLVFGLVGLHLVAIVAYALRGKRLVPAMWRGDKDLPPGTPGSADGPRTRGLALALAALCALAVGWMVSSAP